MGIEAARKYALQNAVLHGGKADPKAVLGRMLAEDPSLRRRAREAAAEIERVVADVNLLGVETQRAELAAIAPELLETSKADAGPKELPPLSGAVDGRAVFRLAPYPSGPLHIGNARAFILNDAYAKRYHGKLLLVFDDTIGSEDKPILPEAYDQVREGLDWAGVEYHEVLYKSDRIPLHYEWAEKILATGEAYVCECDAETLRRNREAMHACVHRIQDVDETIAMWKAMLAGEYREGEAVVRLKTDMAHPNPAFRDRVLFRIADREHPRVGDRYRVWPMLEFSWAVDDALLAITHVLRGKDLVMEDMMETRIWDVLGVWPRPAFVHFGILRFKDLELSKSRYRREI
ncbi:MAG TPA: glutamate--tRNA ligase family protein, partial [Thermoplasmata archaeon]|nr:glutamate--tRNA ligase family protein [Thermoplasmata archaeon]